VSDVDAGEPVLTATRTALVEVLKAIRVRGEMSALSGQHPHMTDADLADLIIAELALTVPAAPEEPRSE
jgi:hypothetical protein